MLSDKVAEQLTELLVKRIEEGNTYILKMIAKNIYKIGTVSPSDVNRLVQILKYGGSYEQISRKLAGILNLNVTDIYKIFEEVAKKDQYFAKQFYKYRNIDYIPYEENKELKNFVKAIARQTAETYINLSKTSAIGFTMKDINGNMVFKGIKKAYYEAIDEAVLNIGSGKETFDNAVKKIINNMGSGIKTVNYQSGRAVRLDSAVRMNVQGALRDLHNNLQQQFGKEFDADGIEISVHSTPAEDHADLQGRQFSNEEYIKLQFGMTAKDYKGNVYEPFIVNDKGRLVDRRPISELNCYHYIFAVVLGINEPEYTDKQLKEIEQENQKGFEYEGKHYTMYEGTQLQRRLETEIRKQKDIQIMAKETNNQEKLYSSQNKINILTNKYNELCNISGLRRKPERLRVSGYKKNESVN